MKKSHITRIWIAGSIILVIGVLLGGINLVLMLVYGGHFVPSTTGKGSDFIPNLDRTFWTTLSLLITGSLIAALGILIQTIGWIGALINSYAYPDKLWFIALLVSGLVGLGFPIVAFAGMIAYLVAGQAPDTSPVPTTTPDPLPVTR